MDWLSASALFLKQNLATVLGVLLALVLFSRVLRDQERPSTSIAWLVSFALIPLIGIPAYLLFGGRKLVQRAKRKRSLVSYASEPSQTSLSEREIERTLLSYGLTPARAGNHATLVTDDASVYRRLCERIDEARHTIQITTFIFGNDAVGRDLIRRLCAKAATGVRVQLLVDALGSLRARLFLLRKLEQSGGEVAVFMRIFSFQRKWSANLRNHRKIAIFDGRCAVLGGFNLAAEYLGPNPRGDRWLDTAIEITGPIVDDLLILYDSDWSFATARPPCAARERSTPTGTQVLQLVPSGPDVEGDPFYDALLSAVYRAESRVWLATPYFVPDEGLLRALLIHARLGKDIRVIVPAKSNHWLADQARAQFLRRLQHAGAKVYRHPQRMIHAKHIIIDDDLTVAGSANFDLRSFYLNYEAALFVYRGELLKQTEQWLEDLMQHCDSDPLLTPGFWRRWREDLAWLVSPLL